MIPMVESSERGPQRRKRESAESGEGERWRERDQEDKQAGGKPDTIKLLSMSMK